MNKGLEALERITLKDFILNNDSCLKDIKIIEKELRTLEIIKSKKVNMLWFIVCNNINEYNNNVHWENARLTQEEYDLLKEVSL